MLLLEVSHQKHQGDVRQVSAYRVNLKALQTVEKVSLLCLYTTMLPCGAAVPVLWLLSPSPALKGLSELFSSPFRVEIG